MRQIVFDTETTGLEHSAGHRIIEIGCVEIVNRRDLADAADPVAKRAELVEAYTEQFCNPWEAADRGYVDDVIDPAETRAKLIAGFAMLRTKREELPKRKHGNVPL